MMQNYQYFDLTQKIMIFTPNMRFFWGKNWAAGLTRLELLSQIDQNICTKNDQNGAFVSEAVHGENAIWKFTYIFGIFSKFATEI